MLLQNLLSYLFQRLRLQYNIYRQIFFQYFINQLKSRRKIFL